MVEISWRVRLGRECLFCGEMRRASMHNDRKAVDGHSRRCKSCHLISTKQWHKDNAERSSINNKKYRQTNSDKYKAHWKQWSNKNQQYLAKYREDNREAHRQATKLWNEQNPEKRRAIVNRRRARQQAAIVEDFTDAEIFMRDEYICYLCNSLTDPTLPRFNDLRTVLEHKIPLSRGGNHSRENCATACWKCNIQKGNKMEDEYRHFLSKVQS